MDQVLQTPEIVARIMEFIHENKGYPGRTPLTPMARVNSLWRELAQRIVWTAPPLEALARITSPRRRLFAPYIRTLNFGGSGDPTLHTLFADLRFTRLRELTLGNFPIDPLSRQRVGVLDGWNFTVSQYLQPTLEVLVLVQCDSICTASFFNQLTTKCPRLKRIFFSEIGAQIQPDEFLNFFRALSHLEAIELNLGTSFSKSVLITGDFLLHLSQMPKLKYLEIRNSLDQPDFFQMIRDENGNPFQSLTKVVLPVSAHPVSLCFLIYVLHDLVHRERVEHD
jgi:hypothetical protein